MRIYSSATWLSSASLASLAVASNITFNTDGFQGAAGYFDNGTTYQSTILSSSQLDVGNSGQGLWMITWAPSKEHDGPTVKSIVLATKQEPEKSIAYGTDNNTSADPKSFSVDFLGGSLTLESGFVTNALSNNLSTPLFFQIEWLNGKDLAYSYSLPWAVADSSDATQLLYNWPYLVTDGAPAYPQGSSPTVTTGELPTTAGNQSLTSTASSSSSSSGSSVSKDKSGGLSTGAIVGIVVGVVAALIIISFTAGCLCLRRRRRNNNAGGEGAGGGGGACGQRDPHAVQDMVAEKEARAGIREGDQLDMPYSERVPNRGGLGLGLGLGGGMNESGVDMGVGMGAGRHAVSEGGDTIDPCQGHYVVAASDRECDSGAGTTAGGSGSSSSDSLPTRTHPSSIHERRPSVPCASAQTGHAYAPCPLQQQQQQQQQRQAQYGYGQHHDVADGTSLANEGHFDDDENAARGTPCDGHQPVSPDSARGSAGGGIGGGGTHRMREVTNGGRSATPSGISGRYAHLVEEGMTCDEIRRLEEEERALDEAIEQHGRGR